MSRQFQVKRFTLSRSVFTMNIPLIKCCLFLNEQLVRAVGLGHIPNFISRYFPVQISQKTILSSFRVLVIDHNFKYLLLILQDFVFCVLIRWAKKLDSLVKYVNKMIQDKNFYIRIFVQRMNCNITE